MKKRFLKYPLIGLVLGALIVPTLVSCNPINEPYNNIQIPLPDNNHNNGGSSNQLPPEPPPESPPPPQIIEPDITPKPPIIVPTEPEPTPEPEPEPETSPGPAPELPPPPPPQITEPDINGGDNSLQQIERPVGAQSMSELRKPIPKLDDLYGIDTISVDIGNGNPDFWKKVVKATENEFHKIYEQTGSYFDWYKQEFDYQAHLLKYYNFGLFRENEIKKVDIYFTEKTGNSITYEIQALTRKSIDFKFFGSFTDQHVDAKITKIKANSLIKITVTFSINGMENIGFPIDFSSLRYPWSINIASLNSWDPYTFATQTLRTSVFGLMFEPSNVFPINNNKQLFSKNNSGKSIVRYKIETKNPDSKTWDFIDEDWAIMRLKLLSIHRKSNLDTHNIVIR